MLMYMLFLSASFFVLMLIYLFKMIVVKDDREGILPFAFFFFMIITIVSSSFVFGVKKTEGQIVIEASNRDLLRASLEITYRIIPQDIFEHNKKIGYSLNSFKGVSFYEDAEKSINTLSRWKETKEVLSASFEKLVNNEVQEIGKNYGMHIYNVKMDIH